MIGTMKNIRKCGIFIFPEAWPIGVSREIAKVDKEFWLGQVASEPHSRLAPPELQPSWQVSFQLGPADVVLVPLLGHRRRALR